MGERSKKSWIAISMSLLIILAAWAAYAIHGFSVLAQEWVPYVPPSDIVTLYHYMVDSTSYVSVSIAFPHPEFIVSDWGVPTIVGGDITVNAEIWEYTGPVSPVVTIVEHTYELGELPLGEYNFTFMVWENPVKSLTFSITHDIAITDVLPYKNVVAQNSTAFIMVTVENQGSLQEIFNLTAYYNETRVLIERWFDPDGSLSDTFWSLGDANRDGYVDYYDAYLVAINFGWIGPPGENPADVWTDGTVNVIDQVLIGRNFNLTIWDRLGIPKLLQDYAVVALNTSAYKIIGFRWNTTNCAKGNYTISAYAWPVQGEEDLEDNTLINGVIALTIVGDVNGDGQVDLKDVFAEALAYGSYPRDPRWNTNLDTNDDINIDLKDYYTTVLNYGKTDP